MLFHAVGIILIGLFIFFGMDVRHKKGSSNFVSFPLLMLMKILSFALIACFALAMLTVSSVDIIDWLCLIVLASGTAFIVAAKRTLRSAHTFTGQYLDKPMLVTNGIYSFTRNPLYFGVFQCEIAAAIFICRNAALIWPENYLYILATLTIALIYAVVFNIKMAILEARYLHSVFGEAYASYKSRTPFLFPAIFGGRK